MYEVIRYKLWVNKVTGATASIYGAVPYRTEQEKKEWEMVERGYTIYNTVTNTTGMGRPPFDTYEEAAALVEKWNKQ